MPDGVRSVAAIAITGFTRTQVLIDWDGNSVRPAFLWNDTRANPTLPELIARCPAGHHETAALNAYHPLARLWWLRQNEPGAVDRIAHVLEPKDFLNLRLSGAIVTDPISQARLAAAARPESDGVSLLQAAGLSDGLVPPLHPPLTVVGHVKAGHRGAMASLEGVPVIGLAHDTWASVVGLGAMRDGLGYNLSGTTEVLGVLTSTPASADGLVGIDWGGNLFQLGGPSLAGGDTVKWLLELLGNLDGDGKSAGAALDALMSARRDSEPVLFLPFLQGERVPYWDPNLRGLWLGLNRRHRQVDLAWSVLEGIAFLNRLVLERAEAATGQPVTEVRYGGGGATNPIWCQIKADVLNREIAVPAGDEHGLLGAAVAAWTALGRFQDLQSAQSHLVQITRRYLPSPGARSFYDRCYAIFRESNQWALALSRQWAAGGWETPGSRSSIAPDGTDHRTSKP
jgi:xylulokinase